MEFRVNYTLVGLFVVLLGAACVSIILWMTSSSRKVYDPYLVYMNEAVSGLTVEAPVKFNGVDVGYVADISLNPKNPQQVRLLLNIQRGTPITESTVATLMAQGITGLTYIGLKARTAQAPLLTATPESPYPVIKSVPSLLVQLDTVIRDTATNLKTISQTFQRVFNKDNQAAINQSLKNIAQVTNTLAANSAVLTQTLHDSQRFLRSATLTSQQLNDLSKALRTTIQTGNATLQALSQQALPDTLQAMQQLNEVLSNLQQLSNELSNNPAMLLRGKATAPLGPGES